MKPNVLTLCLPLAFALTAPALAQNSVGTPAVTPPTVNTLPPPVSLGLPASASDKTALLATDQAQYSLGQPIRITFTLANPGKMTVGYNTDTAQQFDIVALDAKGAEVWRWSRGKTFPSRLTYLKLAPGEQRTFMVHWNGKDSQNHPVAPGIYTLKANFLADNLPGVTGGVIVDTSRDPSNIGLPTRSAVETGAIRQIPSTTQLGAQTTVTIGSPAAK